MGHIFLIAAAVTVVSFVAVVLLPNRPLRQTIDIEPDTLGGEDLLGRIGP